MVASLQSKFCADFSRRAPKLRTAAQPIRLQPRLPAVQLVWGRDYSPSMQYHVHTPLLACARAVDSRARDHAHVLQILVPVTAPAYVPGAEPIVGGRGLC